MRNFLILTIIFSALTLGAQEDGKTLFRNNCKACHNIDRNLVGPALKDIHTKRDSVWLYAFIKSSQTLINSGDEAANDIFMEFNQVMMPDQNLSNSQIASILDYIKEESGGGVDQAASPITRPAIFRQGYNKPLHFNQYVFWIPFTIAVLLLIAGLYYMTLYYDLKHGRK